MDPNACLEWIVQNIIDLNGVCREDPTTEAECRADLVENLGNLRTWVKKGGSIPTLRIYIED